MFMNEVVFLANTTQYRNQGVAVVSVAGKNYSASYANRKVVFQGVTVNLINNDVSTSTEVALSTIVLAIHVADVVKKNTGCY